MPDRLLLTSHSPSSPCDCLHHHNPGGSQPRSPLLGAVYPQRAHELTAQPLGHGTSGSSRPQRGLSNRYQSPLCWGMDVSDASLTVLVWCRFSLHLWRPCQTGKQANAVCLLSNQCHAQPLRYLYSAAWGHGQHTMAQLLSGTHPARAAFSWLWVPSARDQRAGDTTELAQERLSSGSHGGMETPQAVRRFSGQITLTTLLWRSAAQQWGPVLLQQRHPS